MAAQLGGDKNRAGSGGRLKPTASFELEFTYAKCSAAASHRPTLDDSGGDLQTDNTAARLKKKCRDKQTDLRLLFFLKAFFYRVDFF